MEEYIDELKNNARETYRLTSTDYKFDYERQSKYVSEDLRVIFFGFHADWLIEKRDSMYNDIETTIATCAASKATKFKNVLLSSNIIILPRDLLPNPNNVDLTTSGKKRVKDNKKSERVKVICKIKSLVRPKAEVFMKMLKKEVSVLSSITNEVVKGVVMIGECSNIDKIDFYDYIVWRVDFNGINTDMYLNTEAMKAVFELSELGNGYLFKAPLPGSKRKRKALVVDNGSNKKQSTHYLNSSDFCFNVGQYPRMSANSEQSSLTSNINKPGRCVIEYGGNIYISKFTLFLINSKLTSLNKYLSHFKFYVTNRHL